MDELLKKKIEESFKEDFIGDVIFDDSELVSIYDTASLILRSVKNERGTTIDFLEYKLIFVALVNVIKEWNSNETAFLEFIYRSLLGTEDGNGKVYTEICKVINNLSRNGSIYILDSFHKKYYATLISHAFAPVSSTESFFNMCWEIYSKDLDYYYSKGDSVYSLIADSLKNKFSYAISNEDDFTVGSKVYSFRAGLKGLALDETEMLSKLVERTIRDIDSLFNSVPIPHDKYYENIFLRWWKQKEEEFGKVHESLKYAPRSRIVSDYSQIKAKYILNGTKLCIEVPAFRLQDNIDYEPYILLKINGSEVLSEPLYIKGSGIIASTSKYRIDLSNYYMISDFDLTNVELSISHAGKEIYNSKKSLNRKFVLFKDVREIYSNDCIPGQYNAFIINLSKLSKYPDVIHREDQYFYSLDATEGEYIQSDDRFVFFESEKIKRNILIHGKYIQTAKYIEDGEEYQIVDGEIYIDVSDEVNVLDFGVSYDGTVFKLFDFPYEIIDGYKRYTISNLINVGEIGKLIIFKYSTNETVQTLNFIKFNNVRITYDKKLYYDEDHEGIVEFITDKFHEASIFDIKDDDTLIEFGNGQLQFFPPRLEWKIDDGNYNYSSNRKLWWKDLNNSTVLEISVPKDVNVDLILSSNLNNFVERVGNENKFKLGQTIHSLAYSDVEINPVMVISRLNDGSFKLIAEIYLKETFIDDPISIESETKRLHWNSTSFVGNLNKKFTLNIKNNERDAIKPLEFMNDKCFVDLDMLSDGYYDLTITSIELKGFKRSFQVLYNKEITLGNEKNLKFLNKTLRVRKAMFFDKSTPNLIRPIYIDNIEYLTTRDGFDLYKGSLYIKKQHGIKYYFNKLEDRNGNLVEINPVRLEIMNNASLYIGYGLDMDDPEFDFNGEFCIDRDMKICISNRGFVFCPDYFYFEEEK